MSIATKLAAILAAKYGRDVRQAIHDSIEQCYDDAIELNNMNVAEAAAETAVSAASAAAESALQLAAGVASPAGTYATIAALASENPDHSKIYVVTADGHWYYWSGSAWADGGVYQATAIADGSVTPAKLSFTHLRITDSKNLFDKSTVTAGSYVNHDDGTVTATVGYYASDWIAVDASTAYYKNTFEQVAFYDTNKAYISGYPNANNAFTTPGGTAYLRITVPVTPVAGAGLETAQVEAGASETSYQTGLQLIKREQIVDFPGFRNGGQLVIVSKIGGDFTTIQGAADAIADSGPYRRYTILIMPGEYNEAVSIQTKYIDLVGWNLGSVVIRTTSGEYATPPLEMSCLNNVKNIIFWSDESTKDPGYAGEPAYCIHHDYVGVGSNYIENCKLISSSSCAIGIGTHQDQHITIRNCELTSTVGARPPLLFHPNVATTTNQKLVVDNCRMWGVSYSVLSIIDSNNFGGSGDNRDTEIAFYNNMLWSEVNGCTDIVYNPNGPSVEGAIDGYILLSPESYGNNAAEVTPDAGVVDLTESFERYALWRKTSSANPVSVYPVPESPLYTKVSGTYTQSGTGDPSPSNIRPITPWLANGATAKVKRTGKNLFNLNVFTDGYYFSTNGETKPLSAWRLSNYIPCSPSIAMKLSGIITFPNSLTNNFEFYDKNLVYIGYLSVNGALPVTPIAGSCFVRFSYKTTEAGLIQFELGSTATPYEPYSGQEITLTAPQEITAGWMDNEGQGEVTWGKYLMTNISGIPVWSIPYNTPTSTVFYRGIVNRKFGTSNVLTDKLRNIGDVTTNSSVVNCIYGSVNDTAVYTRLPFETVEAANAWLASNPVTVYYQLATPVPLTPTIAPMIALPQLDRITPRQNVLTATPASGIELTYAKSPIQESIDVAAAIV